MIILACILILAALAGIALAARLLADGPGTRGAPRRSIRDQAADAAAQEWLIQRHATRSQPPAHLFPPLDQPLIPARPPAEDPRWPHLARPWADDTGTFSAETLRELLEAA